MSATDKIAKAKALIEPLRATVLWQNANPNVMKAADLLAALADLADAQAQENAKLRTLAREYRPSMDAEVLRSWAEDVVRAALGETP